MATKKTSSRVLTGHEEIRSWAEERGAKPACVRRTGAGEIGMIRLEFPDAPHANDANLEEIGWDDFFGKFDESALALLVQDELAGGGQSNFNKLVGRETAAAAEKGEKTSRRAQHGSGIAKGRGTTSAGAGAKRNSAKKSSSSKSAMKKSSASSRTAARKSAAKKSTAKKSAAKTSAKKKSASSRTSTQSAATRRGAKTGNSRSTAAKKSGHSSASKKKSTGSSRSHVGSAARGRSAGSKRGSAASSGRRSR